MGYECRQLQNYTSYSWNSRTTTKNSRVANARRQTVPSHIISKTLRTLSGAKLHRQSMQDNKLGDDKKERDHRMLGANWRSSDMNDASRQIEKLTSTWPWQGVEQWPDTWDSHRHWRAMSRNEICRFSFINRVKDKEPMKTFLSRCGAWNGGSNPSLFTEQAFWPCRQRNTQTRGKQTGNETRRHQLTLNDKQTLLSLMTLA